MKQTDISIGRSVQYSLGNTATNIMFIFISSYLMFFYTNVMGLSGTIAGAVFMTARLVDAFTDPLMGLIVDRTNTKRFGKYRPYFLFATPFMGIFFVLVFYVPDMNLGMKIVYSYVTYILYSLAWTAVQTPYLAMQIVLSPEVNKRSRLVAIVQGISSLAGFITGVTVIPMLNAFGGQTNAGAWMPVCIILALLFIILFYISTYWVKEYDAYQPPIQNYAAASGIAAIMDQFKAVLKNLPLILIIIGYTTDAFAMQISTALNMYFYRYNLDGRTDLIAVLGMVSLPLSLGMMVIIPPISRRLGKRWGVMIAEMGAIVFTLLLFLAAPARNIPLVMASSIGASIMFGLTNTLSRAAVYDCANYAEWKLGIRADALISSIFTFVNKVSQAVSALFMGVLLDKAGYSAQAARQTEQTLNAILGMKVWVPIVAFAITIAALVFYPLSKEKEQEMSRELADRREAAASL